MSSDRTTDFDKVLANAARIGLTTEDKLLHPVLLFMQSAAHEGWFMVKEPPPDLPCIMGKKWRMG